MSNILVVAAHPDDEILGVGGTVHRLASGCNIFSLILATGLISRDPALEAEIKNLRDNGRKAGKTIGYIETWFEDFIDQRMDTYSLLDIIKVISKYVDKIQPETVFTHHHGDINIDHRITAEATLTACRPLDSCSVRQIYGFDTVSSTEWNFFGGKNDAFKPNVFFELSEENMITKLNAMRCYEGELRESPHPRSIEILTAQAIRYGSVIMTKYAEAFELYYDKKTC